MEKDDTPTFLQRRWQLMMMNGLLTAGQYLVRGITSGELTQAVQYKAAVEQKLPALQCYAQ